MREQNGMLVHRTEGTGDHAHECALAQEVHLVRELGVRVVMHASGSVCYSSQRLRNKFKFHALRLQMRRAQRSETYKFQCLLKLNVESCHSPPLPRVEGRRNLEPRIDYFFIFLRFIPEVKRWFSS